MKATPLRPVSSGYIIAVIFASAPAPGQQIMAPSLLPQIQVDDDFQRQFFLKKIELKIEACPLSCPGLDIAFKYNFSFLAVFKLWLQLIAIRTRECFLCSMRRCQIPMTANISLFLDM